VEAQPQLFARATAAAGGDAPTGEVTRAIVDQHLGVDRRADGKVKPPGLQVRRTPPKFYGFLNDRFGPFKLDAYADESNALAPRHINREQDGNKTDWADVTYFNPEFDDMTAPLEQAIRMAERGIRSVGLGPVGCSQAWYHELAIRGTIYVPDRRINFDLPDGAPTDGADRDTIVMAFGREHYNRSWRRGVFQVRRLELPEAN
jgi:hypothetical protein